MRREEERTAFAFKAQAKSSRGCAVSFLHTYMEQYSQCGIGGPGAGSTQAGVPAAQGALSSPPRATRPAWYSAMGECAQVLVEKQPLVNASLDISPLLCLNASQCHFFFCNKREGPDLLSNIALRARKERGGYQACLGKIVRGCWGRGQRGC